MSVFFYVVTYILLYRASLPIYNLKTIRLNFLISYKGVRDAIRVVKLFDVFITFSLSTYYRIIDI